MKVSFLEESFDCIKAVRNADSATLHLTDGGIVEFSGVSDSGWNNFQLDGGAWEVVTPTPSDEERLDALEAAMVSVMMGGLGNV